MWKPSRQTLYFFNCTRKRTPAMPKVNVPNRTVHAICHYFAHKPDWPLDSEGLARAVKSKVPEAEIVRGYTITPSGVVAPCSWVQIGGREYDVQRMAQTRRSNVAHSLKCDCAWPEERRLVADTQAERFASALDGWSLPSCAACCGMTKAHTLDEGCVSPWKADLLDRRIRERCMRLGCACYGVGAGHRSQECLYDLERLLVMYKARLAEGAEAGEAGEAGETETGE